MRLQDLLIVFSGVQNQVYRPTDSDRGYDMSIGYE